MSSHRIWTQGPMTIGALVKLNGEEAQRMRKVLRLGAGDRVILVDATGMEGEAEVVDVSSEAIALGVVRVWETHRESPLWVRLIQAVPKGDKMALVVQKATELGVQEVAVLLAQRSVPQWGGGDGAGRMRRWRRVIHEAARQSGRTWIPSLTGPWNLEDLCESLAEREGLKLVLWEGEEGRGLREALGEKDRQIREIWIAVGPEGGFEEAEVRRLERAGFRSVRVGPRILRTETAGPAAVAILQYLYGDLGQ